ncbi:hypothetical protein C8R43DRAFT_1017002 [Mycena crocata]|nr:hypothetical protein C8R43DRAFT_1017002 [Mycena crocata]
MAQMCASVTFASPSVSYWLVMGPMLLSALPYTRSQTRLGVGQVSTTSLVNQGPRTKTPPHSSLDWAFCFFCSFCERQISSRSRPLAAHLTSSRDLILIA